MLKTVLLFSTHAALVPANTDDSTALSMIGPPLNAIPRTERVLSSFGTLNQNRHALVGNLANPWVTHARLVGRRAPRFAPEDEQ